MNNPQHKPMRKRFPFATAILFAVAIIITIPSTAVAQQQRLNSNTSSQIANSSSNPLPKTIFKQLENSVVQITSKIPTIGVSNPSNQSSSNVTTLGSGFVYDKQGHIVTNGHVVGDAMIVDVTFVNGNRYTTNVIGKDIDSDIAVVQISKPQQLLSSLKDRTHITFTEDQ